MTYVRTDGWMKEQVPISLLLSNQINESFCGLLVHWYVQHKTYCDINNKLNFILIWLRVLHQLVSTENKYTLSTIIIIIIQ